MALSTKNFPILSFFIHVSHNAKLTGRTEPACRRSGLQRGVKFAKQMPRCKLSALNAWLGLAVSHMNKRDSIAIWPQPLFDAIGLETQFWVKKQARNIEIEA